MTSQSQQQAIAVAEQTEAVRLASNVEAAMHVGETLTGSNDDITGEVADIRYRKHVSIWNRETGTHSYALPYMVSDLAKQRIKAGPLTSQSAFVFRKEDLSDAIRNKPMIQKIPCYLNEAHPDSARYHGMGFAHCISPGAPSQAALESHMAHTHKRAWDTIQKEVVDAKSDAVMANDAANTKALQALVAQLVANQQLTPAQLESPAGQAAVEAVSAAQEPETETTFTATCQACGEDSQGRSQAGAEASLRGHIGREHPPE